MEAVGNDPTQAYLCAGVLQTLELSIAQRLHKSFSKITRQCRLYDSNGYIRETKRCPNAPTICYSLDQGEFLVCAGNFEIPTSSFQSQPSAFDNTHSEILGTRGWFRSNYKHLIKMLPPHSVSRAKFFEKYTAFERYFYQRTSVLIQLFPPLIHFIPYWTDFAYRSSSYVSHCVHI